MKAFLFGLFLLVASQSYASDIYFIALKKKALFVKMKNVKDQGGKQQALKLSEHKKNLDTSHDNLLSKLRTKFPEIKIRKRFYKFFNGVSIELPSNYSHQKKKDFFKKIKLLSQVISVEKFPESKKQLNTSLPAINVPAVHSMTGPLMHPLTGKDIRIAVIDGGIDISHPEFGGECLFTEEPNCKIAGGWDYCDNDADPREDKLSNRRFFDEHGTFVASIAAGLSGVAPAAKLYSYRTFKNIPLSSACVAGFDTDEAIFDVIENRLGSGSIEDMSCQKNVDIVNMSFVMNPSNFNLDMVEEAIETLTDCGILFVAAAGNHSMEYGDIPPPANFRSVIAVASVDHRNQQRMSGSGRGPRRTRGEFFSKPDLMAPGVDICGALGIPSFWDTEGFPTCEAGGFGSSMVDSGTSFAAPHVTGVAALLIQAYPSLSAREIRDLLLQSSTPLLDIDAVSSGHGFLNALSALNHPVTIKFSQDVFDMSVSNSVNFQHKVFNSNTGIGMRVKEIAFKHQPLDDFSVGASSIMERKPIVTDNLFCLMPESASAASPSGIPPEVTVLEQGEVGSLALGLNPLIKGNYFSKLEIEYFENCSFTTASSEHSLPLIVQELRTLLIGDLTGDGIVDSSDLAALVAEWGNENSPADLNNDGNVDGDDLAALLVNWT